MVKSRYRGINELESRVDRGEKCLAKYQSINPTGLIFTAAVMCRIMLISEFDPFIMLYDSNGFIYDLTEEFAPVDSLLLEQVYNLSREFLLNYNS